MISSEMVINNKTVVSTGGPGLSHVMDKYNQEGNWNREYQPTEPQQIHTTWVSDGKQFKVQFSTLSNIKSASLIYWLSDEDQDMDSIVIRNAKVSI